MYTSIFNSKIFPGDQFIKTLATYNTRPKNSYCMDNQTDDHWKTLIMTRQQLFFLGTSTSISVQ